MALDLASDTLHVAAADLASCELGGEAVLLNVDTGVYYGLDPVGTHVWRLLQQPRSMPELRDLITDEFDVSPDRAEADLLAFVSALNSHGLVRPADVATR